MTPTSLEQERMSNVQKAEEAALRVLGHLSSNGTYTVEFSNRDGNLVFKAHRSDGVQVGRHKQGAVFSGEATASDDTAKKDAERRVAKMFGVEVPT